MTVAAQVAAEEKLSEVLRQFAGRWVAVRNHEVVANAETLQELRLLVGDDAVDAVFEVPDETGLSFY
jgi:hypothetical protein